MYEREGSDADGDDVGDVCDDCPGTAPGVPVDSSGCPIPIRSDQDHDGDVDQSDFADLQKCFTGPVLTVTPECQPADLDNDTHVDADDLTIFLSCLNGTNTPPAAGCVP